MKHHMYHIENARRAAKTHRLPTLIAAGAIACLSTVCADAANPPISSKFEYIPNIITPLSDVAVNPFVYVAKFVCGPQTLAATRIGQITEYSALEPGNYATALNILPLNDVHPQIEVYASMVDSPINPVVAQFPAPISFRTLTLTCTDIIDSFGLAVSDEAYEGFLYIKRRKPDLEVQAVYTYASRDEFTDWLGVDQQGNVVPNPEINLISIGGAGGLGLGASIDVERIEPIDRSGLAGY